MNDRKIIGLFIIAATTSLIGIIGFTLAYFTSSVDFENEFNTGVFQTTATEVFESPQNWLPGDTEPKTLTITNTGNVDVKARVCIDEEWTSSSDEPLPNVVGGERMAIINLANTSDWTKKGNCYEYNDTLEPNDTTSSFIESVTFNPLAEADVECTTNGNTKECTSTGYGYDNATYTLTLRVETVQANKASELWPDYVYVYYIYDPYSFEKIEYSTIEDLLAENGGNPFYIREQRDYSGDIIEETLDYIIALELANDDVTAGTFSLRYGEDNYESNKTVLNSSFGEANCHEEEHTLNNVTTNIYECSISNLSGQASSTGNVGFINYSTGFLCRIDNYGPLCSID